MPLRVTTWNVEHASKLARPNPSSDILSRRRRVRETLEEIAPDVICLTEGPRGEQAITDFCQDVLDGGWEPVRLRGPGDSMGDRDGDYKISKTRSSDHRPVSLWLEDTP